MDKQSNSIRSPVESANKMKTKVETIACLFNTKICLGLLMLLISQNPHILLIIPEKREAWYCKKISFAYFKSVNYIGSDIRYIIILAFKPVKGNKYDQAFFNPLLKENKTVSINGETVTCANQ